MWWKNKEHEEKSGFLEDQKTLKELIGNAVHDYCLLVEYKDFKTLGSMVYSHNEFNYVYNEFLYKENKYSFIITDNEKTTDDLGISFRINEKLPDSEYQMKLCESMCELYKEGS